MKKLLALVLPAVFLVAGADVAAGQQYPPQECPGNAEGQGNAGPGECPGNSEGRGNSDGRPGGPRDNSPGAGGNSNGGSNPGVGVGSGDGTGGGRPGRPGTAETPRVVVGEVLAVEASVSAATPAAAEEDTGGAAIIGDLPMTGASLAGLLGAALLSLVIGVVFVVRARRVES